MACLARPHAGRPPTIARSSTLSMGEGAAAMYSYVRAATTSRSRGSANDLEAQGLERIASILQRFAVAMSPAVRG